MDAIHWLNPEIPLLVVEGGESSNRVRFRWLRYVKSKRGKLTSPQCTIRRSVSAQPSPRRRGNHNPETPLLLGEVGESSNRVRFRKA
jgi:hypothetical protein